MIALDYILVIQVIAFLVFWFVLTKLLFKPLLGIIEERERRTEGSRAQASAVLLEAEKLRSEYESRLTQVRAEGNAAKESLRNEAVKARDVVLAQARAESSAALEKVREEIQRELQNAMRRASQEAETIARQMAEQALGRKVA